MYIPCADAWQPEYHTYELGMCGWEAGKTHFFSVFQVSGLFLCYH